ncbi:hypothetical protein EVAR_31749_1 [Eumeta japonica]|uniref:Uncharacterized protein n=1 Tax=Eumeta variegata TaxID=151549 RepID=A0A4C1W6Q3_EUMVA|nr:hypothetical protein EVAR_31749_1 [Eumeta japonica]
MSRPRQCAKLHGIIAHPRARGYRRRFVRPPAPASARQRPPAPATLIETAILVESRIGVESGIGIRLENRTTPAVVVGAWSADTQYNATCADESAGGAIQIPGFILKPTEYFEFKFEFDLRLSLALKFGLSSAVSCDADPILYLDPDMALLEMNWNEKVDSSTFSDNFFGFGLICFAVVNALSAPTWCAACASAAAEAGGRAGARGGRPRHTMHR